MPGRLITDNHVGFDIIEDDYQKIYTPHLPYVETDRIYDEMRLSVWCVEFQLWKIKVQVRGKKYLHEYRRKS